ILDLLCDEDRAHFDAVQEGLTTLGVEFKVVPTLVRGLDYYTRTVAEFHLTAPQFEGIAVAGGGRYDGLVQTTGAADMPGTGREGRGHRRDRGGARRLRHRPRPREEGTAEDAARGGRHRGRPAREAPADPGALPAAGRPGRHGARRRGRRPVSRRPAKLDGCCA